MCDKIDEAAVNENIIADYCLIITDLGTAVSLLSLRYAVDPHRIDIILLHSLIMYCLVRLGHASYHHHVLSTSAIGLLQSYNSSPSKMNKFGVALMAGS